MNGETHTFNRKLLLQLAGIVVALPILYVVSSGPMLFIVGKWDSDRATRMRVQSFYQPLSQAIATTPLEKPFDSYLRACGVGVFQVSGKWGTHTVFLLPNTPGVHRRYLQPGETHPADPLKP